MIPTCKGYPYPLPLHALNGFVAPLAGGVFSSAHWHEGEVKACNGHVALRAHKGWWGPEDFTAPGGEFLERFAGLPWHTAGRADEWRGMDELGRMLFRGEPGELFTPDGELASRCGVRVNGVLVVPLALLQLVSMLPRCELWCGPADKADALAFRFSGGGGLIGNHGLLQARFGIFEPRRHDDGARAAKSGPRPSFALPGWPPVDETDCETSV